MSDVEDSPLELLQSRHRKEKKELHEKCLNLKKTAKCGNKQKQKETNAEIEELEKSMKERHCKELDELTKDLSKVSVQESTPSAPQEEPQPPEEEKAEPTFYKEGNISSKNKKKQAKKLEAAMQLKAAIETDQENSLSSLNFIENSALTEVLDKRGLQLFDIRPDGDCLYNSISHQHNRTGAAAQIDGKDVRRRAARFMLEHRDDFLPFITNEDGDSLDEFEYENYCNKVEHEAKDGGVWGGEPELIAISKSLERKIEVIQPEGRAIIYGEDYTTRPLTIVYQRHAYQLGEHYNSTEPKKAA